MAPDSPVWVKTGYSDGGIDWAWHEETVSSEEARRRVQIRNMIGRVIDLLDRIEDLVALASC